MKRWRLVATRVLALAAVGGSAVLLLSPAPTAWKVGVATLGMGLGGLLLGALSRVETGATGSGAPSAQATTDPLESCSFRDVLEAEFAYVRRRRFHKDSPCQVKDSLVGLALSGGGIRSATTNLGVLQSLSQMGVLPLVDYVCTVSGGGYIGSCLSTLLTLDDQTPPQPLADGRTPRFSTEWDNFPFNPATGDGAAQIRHLRTHGSFLVTRKGALKRETLRSIGNLLSGTLYHLVLALLTLSSASLLYMTAFFYGSQAVEEKLRNVTEPVRTFETAYRSEQPAAGRPGYVSGSISEIQGMGKPAFTIPVSYVYPGAWARLKAKFLLIADQWRAVSLRERLSTLLSTLVFGALLAVVSFSYLQRSRKQAARLKPDSPAKGGESAADAFAVRVLSKAGYGSLILMIGWLAVLVWIVDDNPPLDLVLPIVGFGAIFGTTWLLHVVMPRVPRLWTRDMRSLWGAYEAMAVYALGAAIVLAAIPLLVYALREYRAWTGLTGILWLVLARLLTLRNAPDVKKRPISARVLHVLLAVAIGMGLLLTVVTICTFAVPDAHTPEMWRYTGVGFLCAASALLLLGVIGDANRLSPHPFYQDRLAETYLSTDRARTRSTSLELLRDSSEWLLKDLHGQQERTDGIPGLNDPQTSAPLQIISCAINLAGSRDLTRKDRKSGYFTFTKYYSGSRHTGYRRTAEYIGGQMKIARAVTISGAAASSGIGQGTFFAQAFATVLFNLRLGAWLPNPSKAASIRAGGVGRAHFWPKWLWREITMGTDERHSLVNLSDGGHTGDNVGIYPLLQRRCKLIIACDAECDPSLAFGSFTEAIRHAYVDLGIDVDIDLTMLRPDRDTGMSRSHCAVGLIRYPVDKNGKRPVGHLVYLKNSLTGDEPEPVLNYKSSNPRFPHETTADQFFDDAQFESYRALGVHITEHALGEWVTSGEYKKWRRMVARRPTRQVHRRADREGVVHA